MENTFSLEFMLLLNAILVAIIIFQVSVFWKNRSSSQFQENLWNNPKFRAKVEREVDYIALEGPKGESPKEGGFRRKGSEERKERTRPKASEKTEKILRFKNPNFLGSPHEVLGIEKEAPREEIDAAYRHWIKRYHPDRVGHLGQAYIRQANHRTEALNKARAFLLEQQGK